MICYKDGEYKPELEQGRQTTWLTNSGVLDLGSINTSEGFKIQANLQPFRHYDTYAADLTLFPDSPNISIGVNQLALFKPSCLLPNSINASLGQTLWLYGEVDKTDKECAVLAESYATSLLGGTNLKKEKISKDKDKVLGCLFFEYETTIPGKLNNPTENCHIIISINNQKDENNQKLDAAKLFKEAYDWLLNLLLSRHKILFVYQEACKCNPKAREYYSELNEWMKEFTTLIQDRETRLNTLRNLLEQMQPDDMHYRRCLRDLKAHHTAIITNRSNFHACREQIASIGDCPKSWENFDKLKCKQWQDQIKVDIDFLLPGEELFGQMINTIRGIVQIDQVESDRVTQKILKNTEDDAKERDRERTKREKRFSNTVTAIGTGFTSASLFTSASILSSQSSPHVKGIKTLLTNQEPAADPKQDINNGVDSAVAIILPLLIAVLVGWRTWEILKKGQSHPESTN